MRDRIEPQSWAVTVAAALVLGFRSGRAQI